MIRRSLAQIAALAMTVVTCGAGAATPEELRLLRPEWIEQLAHPAPPLPASAQGPAAWSPWRANYHHEAPGIHREWGIDTAQLATFDRNLQSLVGLLRKAPVTQEANAVRLWTASGSMPVATPSADGVAPRQRPVAGGILIGAWPASKVSRDSKGQPRSSGETSHFVLAVNHIPTPDGMEDAEGRFFKLYRVPSPVRGTQALAQDNGLLVIRPGRPDPYLPVSRERVIRAQLARHKDADVLVEQNLQGARERLQRYLSPENAQRRQKRIDEQAAYFRSRNNMSEAMALERATARETAIQRELEAATQPPPTSPVYNAVRHRDAIRAQLADMSPDERAAPAWVSAADSRTDEPLRFVAPETPGAVPIVRANPVFFDKSLPRTSIQIVVLARMDTMSPAARADPDKVQTALLANLLLVQQTDWAAFAAALP